MKKLLKSGYVLYWIAFVYCVVLGQGVPRWLKALAWVGAGFFALRAAWRLYDSYKKKKSGGGRVSN